MGYNCKRLCQLCGNYFYAISHHVRSVHHTTITDLEAEGKWINVRSEEENDRL